MNTKKLFIVASLLTTVEIAASTDTVLVNEKREEDNKKDTQKNIAYDQPESSYEESSSDNSSAIERNQQLLGTDPEKLYFYRVALKLLDLFVEGNNVDQSIKKIDTSLSIKESQFYTNHKELIKNFMEQVDEAYDKLGDEEFEGHIDNLKSWLKIFYKIPIGRETVFLVNLMQQENSPNASTDNKKEKNIAIISDLVKEWHNKASLKVSNNLQPMQRGWSHNSNDTFITHNSLLSQGDTMSLQNPHYFSENESTQNHYSPKKGQLLSPPHSPRVIPQETQDQHFAQPPSPYFTPQYAPQNAPVPEINDLKETIKDVIEKNLTENKQNRDESKGKIILVCFLFSAAGSGLTFFSIKKKRVEPDKKRLAQKKGTTKSKS